MKSKTKLQNRNAENMKALEITIKQKTNVRILIEANKQIEDLKKPKRLFEKGNTIPGRNTKP